MDAKLFRGMKAHKHLLHHAFFKPIQHRRKLLPQMKKFHQHLYLHSRTWSWRSPSRSPCGRTDDWSGDWRTSRHLCSWWSSAWPVRDTTMTCRTECRCVQLRWTVIDNTHVSNWRLFVSGCACACSEAHQELLSDSCSVTWAKWTNELHRTDSFRFY